MENKAFQAELKHGCVYVNGAMGESLLVSGFGIKQGKLFGKGSVIRNNKNEQINDTTDRKPETDCLPNETSVLKEAAKQPQLTSYQLEAGPLSCSSVVANNGWSTYSETVLLLDEEALYLQQKQLLCVWEKNKKQSKETKLSETGELQQVGMSELWNLFRSKSHSFPARFKVYQFFKDRSFVVRAGSQFGVDFCIYRALPSQTHSEFCVRVLDCSDPKKYSSGLGWRDVSCLTRVMPDVMKIPLFCYVLPIDQNSKLNSGLMQTETTSVSLEITSNSANKPLATTMEIETDIQETQEDETKNGGPKESPYLSSLFPWRQDKLTGPAGVDITSGERTSQSESIDFSSPDCLQRLVVRPVTALVRRAAAMSDKYQSITDVQMKYRSRSQKKQSKPRANTVRPSEAPLGPKNGDPGARAVKKGRQRRNHKEVREKVFSKANLVWQQLAGGGGAGREHGADEDEDPTHKDHVIRVKKFLGLIEVEEINSVNSRNEEPQQQISQTGKRKTPPAASESVPLNDIAFSREENPEEINDKTSKRPRGEPAPWSFSQAPGNMSFSALFGVFSPPAEEPAAVELQESIANKEQDNVQPFNSSELTSSNKNEEDYTDENINGIKNVNQQQGCSSSCVIDEDIESNIGSEKSRLQDNCIIQ